MTAVPRNPNDFVSNDINDIGMFVYKYSDRRLRVRVHKQHIKDPSVRNTPCYEHFAEYGQGKF